MNDIANKTDEGKRCPPWGKVAVTAARDDRLSAAHYRLLIVLAAHAKWPENDKDAPGLAFPFLSTIEDLHGISKGTVSDYARQLEAWGYIKIERVPSPRGGRPRQRYTVFAVGVDLPAEFDIALVGTRRSRQREGRKFGDLRTSEVSELGTSKTSELRSSETSELASSDRPNFNREQRYGTDVSEQRYDKTHTQAAAAQTANGHVDRLLTEEYQRRAGQPGVGRDVQAEGDGRIKISLSIAPPDSIFRIKQYRDSDDGQQRALADWSEFLAERLREDPEWLAAYPNTYVGRFRDFVRRRSWRRVADQQPPPSSTIQIIGNMKELPWVERLGRFLEADDRHCEWLKWTLDNHGKRMADIDAQRSWAKYATNRKQWLDRREGEEVPF